MRRSLSLTALTLCIGAAAARAQTCLGLPSLAASKLGLAARASGSEGIRGVGADVSVGESGGTFAQLGVDRRAYERGTAAWQSGFAVASEWLPGQTRDTRARTRRRFEGALCPLAQVSFETGPDSAVEVTGVSDASQHVSTWRAGAGVAVGVQLPLGAQASLTPFASYAYTRIWRAIDTRLGLTTYGADAQGVYGELTAGAGLTLGRRAFARAAMTLAPSWTSEARRVSASVGLRFTPRDPWAAP